MAGSRNCPSRFPARASLLCAAVIALGGCSVSRTDITLRVTNRASGDPVSDAAVSVRPMTFFAPVHPYPQVFGSTRGERGVTGSDGTVLIKVAENAPNQITVVRLGYLPFRATLQAAGVDSDGRRMWLIDAEERDHTDDHPTIAIDVVSTERADNE